MQLNLQKFVENNHQSAHLFATDQFFYVLSSGTNLIIEIVNNGVRINHCAQGFFFI
jgi:hypothetical protein